MNIKKQRKLVAIFLSFTHDDGREKSYLFNSNAAFAWMSFLICTFFLQNSSYKCPGPIQTNEPELKGPLSVCLIPSSSHFPQIKLCLMHDLLLQIYVNKKTTSLVLVPRGQAMD